MAEAVRVKPRKRTKVRNQEPQVKDTAKDVAVAEETGASMHGQRISRSKLELAAEEQTEINENESSNIEQQNQITSVTSSTQFETEKETNDDKHLEPQTKEGTIPPEKSIDNVAVMQNALVAQQRPDTVPLSGTVHSKAASIKVNEKQDQVKSVASPQSFVPTFPISAVEDPNTPMSRVSTPSSSRVMSPYAPTVVQEEKSPNLLAQEALAKLQSLTLTTDSQSDSTPVKTKHSIPGQLSLNTVEEAHTSSLQTVASSSERTTHQSSITTQATSQSLGLSKEASHAYPTRQLEMIKAFSEEREKVKAEPMTLSQLLSFYYNSELVCNDAFVDDFVQNEIKRGSNHEFMEILSNYFRARHQLSGVEEDIKSLQKKYAEVLGQCWIVQPKTISVTGQCGDQYRVTATHQYTQRILNKDTVSSTEKLLEKIREHIANHLCLFSYSAQLSKLQVESYIHDLYTSCPLLCDIPKNASIQGWSSHSGTEAERQINRFKECISILFMFHRKPSSDPEFTDSIRKWTIRLASSLLRVGTFSDHLYILNHILRCPAGVSKWASQLVQCPSGPRTSGVSSPTLDHIVTAIATVLRPTRAREEFMCQMRVNVSDASIQEGKNWILVDSDGEEDEDSSNSWLYLHENDIVTILGQLPLKDVFAPSLLVSFSDSGVPDYDIRRSTEPAIMQLFSFSTVLIQLLGDGLDTYSMARYRQLNKRLGRLIRQTVSFVSDHWLNFKEHYGTLMTTASIASLQAEFDQLFMRAIYKILTAHRETSKIILGSWQFMADMPYTMVSLESLWQLLWVLHQGQGQMIDLDRLPPSEECEAFIKNPDCWQQLADNLLRTTTSESIYLLTTFANMAGCRSSDETTFIQTITLEVFEIAYICSHTREFCSKVGRELLSGIIQTHPVALSFLLARVREVMDKLGRMSLYLFSDLPVGVWQPSDPDMLILRQWLLNFSLATQENNLAQTILAKINFDVFEQTGQLVVDIRHHRHIALLLVEAYTKYISEKKAGLFIMEGMRQMSSYLTTGLGPEQSFNNWAWDLVLRLKLHQQSMSLHSPGTAESSFQTPMLGQDTWLLPLLKEVSKKTPIACFVALAMTNIGHEITSFISEGLDLLQVLTTSCQYTSAVHILGCVVPLFVDCQQYLLENVVFIQVIQALVNADESLFKTTKSAIMSVEFPGVVTSQLAEMIQAQISSHLSLGKADSMITFWLKVFFKVSKCFTCRNSCYITDTLIRWCFFKKGVKDLVEYIFKDNYQKFCLSAQSSQNPVASMFQWLASGHTLPSYMDSAAVPEFPWLAYMILTVEGEAEVTSGLWQTLVMELHHPARYGVDHALKVTIGKLGVDQAPTAGRLVIYRWAQQALDTPFDHPLLPIIWQRFFTLYLGRHLTDSSMGQRASVGERFFQSMFYSSMLKRMCKRLSETSNFHTNFDPQKREIPRRRHSSQSPTTPPVAGFGSAQDSVFEATPTAPQGDSLEYTSPREFHQVLAHLFQTYSLWLEEPRLHDANLYLPALPPQYEGIRLNQVFQGFAGPWLEFIDLDGVQYELSCLAADWRSRLTSVALGAQVARRGTLAEPENATKRIIRRLGGFDSQKPPPALEAIASPVPPISQTMLLDQEALVHLIKADLDALSHFTKVFSTRRAQHCALDNYYIDLIPQLYKNVSKTVTLTSACKSKVNPLHRCTNPAVLPVQIVEEELQEPIHRQMDQNRVEYKQLMIEALLPTPPNLVMAAVHTENAITFLIKLHQQKSREAQSSNLCQTGCSLFYILTGMVCEDTDMYPPTKQFLTSCIEVLGQQFVSQDPDQVSSVLQLCLDQPHLAGLVSPYFDPNICSSPCLLDMYARLVHCLQPDKMDLVFMLLSKFDIGKWLTTASPNEGQRKRLIETLGTALMSCGPEPKQQCALVYGMYQSHLKRLLESNFPSNLHQIIDMILQGSSTEQLSTQVWDVLLKTCFSDALSLASTSTDEDVDTDSSSEARNTKCVDMRLSTAQVKELLDWLSSFFMHARTSDKQLMSFGLPSKWGRYMSHISFLIGSLLRGYTVKVINGAGDMSPFHVVELVWQPLVAVFSPWIQPLVTSPDVIAAPWLDPDDALAVFLVQELREAVSFLYTEMNNRYEGSGCGVLSLLLMYYLKCLSTKTTPDNVVMVIVSELKSLPWSDLKPDLQLLEAMVQIREVASPACFSLVAQVLPLIQWNGYLANLRTHHPIEVATRAEVFLAVLLIQAHLHPIYGQDEGLSRLLTEFLRYDWVLVDQEGFSCICGWFLQLCDPFCVLAERSSNLALGLRLLKRIAAFHVDVACHSDTVSYKRQSYLHCVVQQLCQLTYRSGVNQEQFSTVIVNLLSEVEAVECTVTSAEMQHHESTALLKEVLSLLNNCNPEGPWLQHVETSISGWLSESPHSLLLVPCISVASKALASLAHMVSVMEAGIAAYFNGMDPPSRRVSAEPLWPNILAVFQMPQLNQESYIEEGLNCRAYLILYTYLRHRRQQQVVGGFTASQCSDDDFKLMGLVLHWTTNAQPSPDDEAKLVLWWHLLLQVAVDQVCRPGGMPVSGTVHVLTRFIEALSQLGQDRTGKGILGAIGLGQKSSISVGMRLLARAIAAFLSLRVVNTGTSSSVHLDPTAGQFHAANYSKSSTYGGDLLALRRNKSYNSLSAIVEDAINTTQDPSKTITEVIPFVQNIVAFLFGDKKYLCDIICQKL